MTEFNTQIVKGEYRLQFETSDKNKFCKIQKCARECVDGTTEHEKLGAEGWISVEERLPTEEKDVLTTYIGIGSNMRFYQVLTYYANDEEPHFQHMRGQTNLKVTHWMPLPKVPERRDNDG